MRYYRRRRVLGIGVIGAFCALALFISVHVARAGARSISGQQGAAQSAPGILSLAGGRAMALQAGATVTVTKRDALVDDADSSGAAGPGDTLQYTIVVTNNSSVDAENVLVTDTLGAGVTLVGEVLVSPIAADDSYQVLGNTPITISAAGGVLNNDSDPDGSVVTATAVASGTSTQGGDISLNADGSFYYNPPAGFSGSDSFGYSIEDGDGLIGGGTIRFVVDDVVWYVDDGAGAGGDGRLNTPYISVSEAESSAGDGDVIFLYEGSYSHDLTLANNQRLVGQGADLATGAGLVVPAGTTLPTAAGSPPTLTGSVQVGQNNIIRGLTIHNGGATALAGANFGDLTVSAVTIQGPGRALDLSNGILAAVFASVSSENSAAEGIRLSGVSGSLAMNGGAIDEAAMAGIHMSGSSATVSYSGTITIESAGAYAVNAFSNSNAELSLAGDITSAGGLGRGIRLADNSGSTLSLNGRLTLSTGSNPAFVATGGGTLEASGSGSTLTTSGATAVTIENTTIGDSGVGFQSISAGNSDKGIVLRNAGSGGFTVSGVGTTDGSGGTLQNFSLRAIEVTNTDNVSFANMTLTNASTGDAGGAGSCDALNTSLCNAAIYLNDVTSATIDNVDVSGTLAEQGINGIAVTGFTLRNSTLTGCGNASAEGCLKMRNLAGTVVLESVNLSFAAEKVVEIHNISGSMTLNVSDSTFRDTNTSVSGADGLEIILNGTALANITVTNSNFLRNRTNGLQLSVEGNSTAAIDITGSTFDAESGPGKGLDLAATGDGSLTFNVLNNPTIHSNGGNAITIAAFDSSSLSGRINNNSDVQAGGAGTSGNGIFVQANDASGGPIEIIGNTVSNIGFDSGIYVTARPDLMSGAVGRLDMTISGNNVTVSVDALYDIELQSQESNVICGDVRNNTASNSGLASFRVREVLGGTVYLEGFSVDAATTWTQNGNSGATVSESPSGAASAGDCASPAHPTLAAEGAPVAQLRPAKLHSMERFARGMAETLAVSTAPAPQPPNFAMSARLAAAPVLQTAAEIAIGGFDLPAGKAVTIIFQVTIDDPFPAGAPQVVNRARVSGSNFPATWSDDPDSIAPGDATVTALDAAYDLALDKDDGGITAEPGNTVIYTLTFENKGNQHADGLVVTETVPANATFNGGESSTGWTCADGSPAGTTCTLEVGLVEAGAPAASRSFAVDIVDPIAAGAVRLVNTATIGAASGSEAGPDAVAADNEASDTTPVEAQPDLRLTKDDGGIVAAPGGTITYTLHYTNTGNQGASGVVVTETVPAHSTFDSGTSTAGWSCADSGAAGASCQFSIGVLAGGNSGTLTFAVTVDQTVPAGVESITNGASIADDSENGAEPEETDNADTVTTALEAVPALQLDKDDGGATPGSGETLVYTLRLANIGNQGAAGLVITETVPANSSFNAAESDAGWECAPDGAAGSVCTFDVDSELPGGDDTTVTFAVDVVNSLPGGVTELENQARASGSEASVVESDDPQTATPGDATITLLNVRSDLMLTKSDGLTETVPGETTTYTIVVGNVGPDAATGASVSDALPDALESGSWTCEAGAGATCGAAAGTGDINDVVSLDVGSTVTYTLTGTVSAGATGTLHNEASVASPTGVSDPDMTNNVASDDTALAPEVDLTLTLNESADPALAGSGSGNLQYTLTITNHGPSLASAVTVENTLTLPAGVTLDGADYEAGNGSFVANVWTVNALPPGSSETLILTLTVGAEASAGADAVGISAAITGAEQEIVDGADDSATARTSVERSIDVQLSASASSDTVTAGSGPGNLTFVITATNEGPSTASGVAISNTLTLPAGVARDSVTPSGGTVWNAATDSWLVGDLAAGDSATLTVIVSAGATAAAASNSIVTEATVQAVNEVDSDGSNNTAMASSSVINEADLVVSLHESHDPVTAGTMMTYTATVTNNGPSDARNVQATTTLDDALLYLESSGCTEDPNGETQCSLGLVEAGATVSFTHAVLIDSAATGALNSNVGVSSDATEQNPGQESASASTAIDTQADLSIHIAAQPEPALAGYLITYTLSITNNGPSRAVNPALSTSLAAELSVESSSCDDLLSAGYLDSGEVLSCQIGARIDDGFSGLLEMTSSIEAATSDAVGANNAFTHHSTVYDNRFSIGDVQSVEGDSGSTAFTFTITRTTNVVASAVDVTAVGETAGAGDDFAALATTVQFAAGGSLTQTVTVDVLGDETVELDESFMLQLSNAVNGGIEDGEGRGAIVNDDSAVITMTNAEQIEGDVGSAALVFTATLSAAVDSGISVDFVTVDDTAQDENVDGDYSATSGTLTFGGAVGEQATITVQVHGDMVMELDESFALALTGLQDAGRDVSLAASQAVAVIENDDEALVSFSESAYVGNEGEGPAMIGVTMSLPSAYTVTVGYESRDASAEWGIDYTPISGTLQFAPGETSLGMPLPVLDDALDEDDETVEIWLSSLSAGTLDTAHNPATLVIVDDDGEPTVGFSGFEFATVEGAPGAVISVTLSHVSGRDASVVVDSSDGTGLAGEDYESTGMTLTIPAGQRVVTFTVPLLDDAIDEADETVTLTLSGATNAATGAVNPATLVIVDDDDAPVAAFSASEYAVAEGETGVVISVTLSHVSGRDVSVLVTSSDGTAVAAEDYEVVSETLTIPAGQLAATITLPIIDDAIEEAAESLTMTLSGATNAMLSAGTEATVVITDDDNSAAPEYIYYFPLVVKQATMPSSESLFGSHQKDANFAVVSRKPVPPAPSRRYGGTFTH